MKSTCRTSRIRRLRSRLRSSLWLFCIAMLLCGCHSPGNHAVGPDPKTVKSPASPLSAGIRFESVAASAGLDYRWPLQPRPMRNLEAFGSGCAFLDYDDDGYQDILLVARPVCKLYHNLKNGRFEDVTERSGLAKIKGYWTGCAVGDVDGDGRLDLVLTGYRCLALLRNDPKKGFVDRTVASRLDPHNRNHWGSSAGFMDLGGRGRMDLVLLNYVIFNPQEPQYCSPAPGVTTGCAPSAYRPEYGEVWENVGSGRFRDVSATSGIKETHGKALVVAFTDTDEHGRMDFYIGNDGTPAELMYNQGGMRFRNIGTEGGVAYGSLDHAIAAMGADWGDYDRDGRPDLIVTAFSDESFALFRNAGHATFEEVNDATGLTRPTFKPLGFGAKWLDIDNDGWPDLIFTTGHVYDAVSKTDPQSTLRQPLMLFHNESGSGPTGRLFRDLAPEMGGTMMDPLLGRGLASGDFDNDGRIDFLAVDFEGAPVLMHNVSTTPNHWMSLNLRSQGPNRFAYGAQVRARSGKQLWIGQVSPASSYLSSSDPRIHWGLGSLQDLDEVAIRWPDGKRELLHNVPADRLLTITEGRGITGNSQPTVSP
jgi:hypothetical protein